MKNTKTMKAICIVLIAMVLVILFFLILLQIFRKVEVMDGARSSERAIVFLMKQRVAAGTLTNIHSGSVLRAFFDANFPNPTNSLGEVVDPWGVHFQIEIENQTNFVVRSAGPNKKFGDMDDIIFNSASNDFVKP